MSLVYRRGANVARSPLPLSRGSLCEYSALHKWASLRPSHCLHSWQMSCLRHAQLKHAPCANHTMRFGAKTPIRFHGTHHGHGHDHGDLLTTLQTSSKRGMRITLIGLAANIGLTLSKGVAGWLMNSASLLADATHSLSDLLSDFTTLYTFRMSRKPPDNIYPYGYGKYETMGSIAVSAFLLAGGAGIGLHSFDLLLAALNASSGVQETVMATTTTTAAENIPSSLLGDGHHHRQAILDPNAAWFALASVVIKEWLYRATLKVGKKERSDVLVANAWHHRSDALSSVVALIAIGGSYAGIPVLDPIGGLVVAGMIMKSGADIFGSAVKELMDKGMEASEVQDIAEVVQKLKEREGSMIGFHSIRGRKQGPFQHVDLVVQVDPLLPMSKAHELEKMVESTIRKEIPQIQQVLVLLEAGSGKDRQYV